MFRSRGGSATAAPVVVLLAMIVVGCAGKKVMVPPRLELAPHARIGLATFTVENAKGGLHELATERFAEYVLSAQPGIELLELGPVMPANGPASTATASAATTSTSRLDAEAIREIGETHRVPAMFLGHLVVSNMKPRASIVDGPNFGADVKLTLSVRLVSTGSGATLWRSSSWARQTIAQLGVVDGQPYFAAKDPDEAYGKLVNLLIYEATRDLRPTYAKR